MPIIFSTYLYKLNFCFIIFQNIEIKRETVLIGSLSLDFNTDACTEIVCTSSDFDDIHIEDMYYDYDYSILSRYIYIRNALRNGEGSGGGKRDDGAG